MTSKQNYIQESIDRLWMDRVQIQKGPPTSEAVQSARAFLEMLQSDNENIGHIGPDYNGGVQVLYEDETSDDGLTLHVEFKFDADGKLTIEPGMYVERGSYIILQ